MSKQPTQLSESDLIALLRKNDKAGFEYLYDHYSTTLYTVICRMIKDEAMAEDILQDAFVKIWKNIDKYDTSKGRLFTWMINLTKNLTIDKTRSKEFINEKKSSPVNVVWSQVCSKVIDGINPDHIGIADFMKKLNANERQLVDLFYCQGYTHSEISKEYYIPLGTVKSRLRSANSNLKRMITE